MAQLLQVRPQDLRGEAQQLKIICDNDRAKMSDMRTLVMQLSQIWQGEAQKAFYNQFMSMQPVFSSFFDMIDQFAEVEMMAADEAEQVDAELLSQINAL